MALLKAFAIPGVENIERKNELLISSPLSRRGLKS
jgi:hypothetical protein